MHRRQGWCYTRCTCRYTCQGTHAGVAYWSPWSSVLPWSSHKSFLHLLETGSRGSDVIFGSHAQAAGLALHMQDHQMRVPRSQRGGDIVEPLVRDQWFVKAKPLAEPALEVRAAAPSLLGSLSLPVPVWQSRCSLSFSFRPGSRLHHLTQLPSWGCQVLSVILGTLHIFLHFHRAGPRLVALPSNCIHERGIFVGA